MESGGRGVNKLAEIREKGLNVTIWNMKFDDYRRKPEDRGKFKSKDNKTAKVSKCRRNEISVHANLPLEVTATNTITNLIGLCANKVRQNAYGNV